MCSVHCPYGLFLKRCGLGFLSFEKQLEMRKGSNKRIFAVFVFADSHDTREGILALLNYHTVQCDNLIGHMQRINNCLHVRSAQPGTVVLSR